MARIGRAGAHPASATVTSFTAASRPGNTLAGHWSVPSAGRARRERHSRDRAGRRRDPDNPAWPGSLWPEPARPDSSPFRRTRTASSRSSGPVTASGTPSIGDHAISAGLPLAGQRVTVRLDGPVAHILSGGTLTRTVACPVPEQTRIQLRGARPGAACPPQLPEPLVVTRRISARGAIMAGGRRIQVGLPHAGKTARVIIEDDTYRISVEDGVAITAPRKTSREILRHKASTYDRP
jgi:hypothetical protein